MHFFLEDITPILAFMVFFSVPLVIILTRHQQKMAMILRGEFQADRTHALAQQVQELTYLTQQQMLSIDTLNQTVARLERNSLPGQINHR